MKSDHNKPNERTVRITIDKVLDVLVATTTGRTVRPWVTAAIDRMTGRILTSSLTATEPDGTSISMGWIPRFTKIRKARSSLRERRS
jgi:hypothetical protein